MKSSTLYEILNALYYNVGVLELNDDDGDDNDKGDGDFFSLHDSIIIVVMQTSILAYVSE